MAPSMREKAGRLQVFAHGKSDSRVGFDVAPQPDEPQPQTKPEPSQAAVSAPTREPTREEIAQNARVSVPKISRHIVMKRRENGVSSQPPPQTTSFPPPSRPSQALSQPPPRPPTRSPVRQTRSTHSPRLNHEVTEDGRLALFAGSELGESFMASGRTTPQTGFEDLDAGFAVVGRESRRFNGAQTRVRSNLGETALDSDQAAFEIGENGYMTVVTGAVRHDPSHMNDGFHTGAMRGHQNVRLETLPAGRERSSSPFERQKKLPLREVKVRNTHHSGRSNDYTIKGEQNIVSPNFNRPIRTFPGKDDDTRMLALYEDFDDDDDDDVDSEDLEEGLQLTPKASRKIAPRKVVTESSRPITAHVQQASKVKKRRRGEADYDDKVLSSMSFTDLQQEPFDFDPTTAAAQNNHDSNEDSLDLKLEQFRQQGEKEQRQLFAAMPLDDWDDAGDWFVGQFTEIMQKLRDVRRNKRRLVQQFETEAADREEAVRVRSDAIDRKLSKMRQDGRRVVEARDL